MLCSVLMSVLRLCRLVIELNMMKLGCLMYVVMLCVCRNVCCLLLMLIIVFGVYMLLVSMVMW